ncbi:4785_t:CDS:2 [Acaulospora morrowiae]|uniref:4785_t:CDS:1 n=1 Tax=Acaulospora morrowiae TaxID=94023 RepID=A0A9N8VQU2_9GLOM|nr:4785_t:CDS:2 [Acaulospora morrowiae]
MNQGKRPARTYNQNLYRDNRENRAALFTSAQTSESIPALRSSTTNSTKYSISETLDLESQNDEKIEGLTGKVKLLKEITLSIGESVKESNALISTMSDEYSQTGNFLDGTMNRLKILAATQNMRQLFKTT